MLEISTEHLKNQYRHETKGNREKYDALLDDMSLDARFDYICAEKSPTIECKMFFLHKVLGALTAKYQLELREGEKEKTKEKIFIVAEEVGIPKDKVETQIKTLLSYKLN